MQLSRRMLFLLLFVTLLLAALIPGTAVAQDGGGIPTITSEPPPMPGLANCIHGIVWYDGNRNGMVDFASEDPMDGASVTLLAADPALGPARPVSARTARDGGYYQFCGLSPGIYEVRVQVPENYLEFIVPVHFLNGTVYFAFWPYPEYNELFLLPSTGNNPARVELRPGEYAEVSVGFGLP